MSKSALIQELTASVVAIITILGAFAIVVYDTVHGYPVELPTWVTVLIGAVVGAYFTHTATMNGARKAGVAAAQTAVNQAVMDRVDAGGNS